MYDQRFQGIGKANIEPIHIETDPNIKPIQQKQRPIALQYKVRFKQHIDELLEEGVVSGPLDSNSARGLVSNVVITHKNWDNQKIRVNLDTWQMQSRLRTLSYSNTTRTKTQLSGIGSLLVG